MFVALTKLSELDRLEREAFESVRSVSEIFGNICFSPAARDLTVCLVWFRVRSLTVSLFFL